MRSVALPTLPVPLEWAAEPLAWNVDSTQTLHVTAGPRTDLFIDPQGSPAQMNAPRLMFRPDPLFTFSAHVHVHGQSTFDAGVLLVYAHDTCWGKLCLERSPQGQPMIVSVVTNGRSDDCNSTVLSEPAAYLRITRLGTAFAFHASHDGLHWDLVRHFALQHAEQIMLGVVAQSPRGESCAVSFNEFSYTPTTIADIRSGL